jgi:hypothetical protein
VGFIVVVPTGPPKTAIGWINDVVPHRLFHMAIAEHDIGLVIVAV